MSQRPCPTPNCGRDMDATAAFCRHCKHTLEVAIANVSAYWSDLATVRTGQTRYGSGGGGNRGRGEQRLAMDTRFDRDGLGTEIRTETMYAVVRWTQWVLMSTSRRPEIAGPACPSCRHQTCARIRRPAEPYKTITSQCAFLLRYADWIRTSARGQEALTAFVKLERRLAGLIDRPRDRWTAGTCRSLVWNDDRSALVQCERKLFFEPGDMFVRCRDCGVTHDVASRREALILEAEDQLGTVETIARVLTTLGDVEVSMEKMAARIRKWVSRGKIAPRGAEVVAGHHRPTYRFGDVFDLVAGGGRPVLEGPVCERCEHASCRSIRTLRHAHPLSELATA